VNGWHAFSNSSTTTYSSHTLSPSATPLLHSFPSTSALPPPPSPTSFLPPPPPYRNQDIIKRDRRAESTLAAAVAEAVDDTEEEVSELTTDFVKQALNMVDSLAQGDKAGVLQV